MEDYLEKERAIRTIRSEIIDEIANKDISEIYSFNRRLIEGGVTDDFLKENWIAFNDDRNSPSVIIAVKEAITEKNKLIADSLKMKENIGDVEVEMFERDFSSIKIKEILENLKDVRNDSSISDKTELFVGVNNNDGHKKITIFSVEENGNVKKLSDGTENSFIKEFQTPENPLMGIDGYKRYFTHLISETQLTNHIGISQILRNSNPDAGRNVSLSHSDFEDWEMKQPSPYDKKNNDVETLQINSEDSALIEAIIDQKKNKSESVFAEIKTQVINHIERSETLMNSNPDDGINFSLSHSDFEDWEMKQPSPYDKKNNDVETLQINSEDSALIEAIIDQKKNKSESVFAKIKNRLAGRGF